MNPNGELRKYMQAIGDVFGDLPGGDPAGNHPDEETLVAYYQNQLTYVERESAAGHLKNCRLCEAKLEDVRDFFNPIRNDEEELSEFEQHRLWRDLREKIDFELPLTAQTQETRRKNFFFNSRAMLALAAGLLVTTSLTGLIAFRLWQEKRALQEFIDLNHGQVVNKVGQVEPEKGLEKALDENRQLLAKLNETETKLQELQQPQINTPVSEITVDDTVHSSSAKDGRTELTTTLPPKANFFTITLNILSDSFPTYRIEFTELNGKSVLNQSNLKPNERANEKSSVPRPNQNATLSVSLPRQSLNRGNYIFRVYGQKGDQSVLLEALKWSFN